MPVNFANRGFQDPYAALLKSSNNYLERAADEEALTKKLLQDKTQFDASLGQRQAEHEDLMTIKNKRLGLLAAAARQEKDRLAAEDNATNLMLSAMQKGGTDAYQNQFQDTVDTGKLTEKLMEGKNFKSDADLQKEAKLLGQQYVESNNPGYNTKASTPVGRVLSGSGELAQDIKTTANKGTPTLFSGILKAKDAYNWLTTPTTQAQRDKADQTEPPKAPASPLDLEKTTNDIYQGLLTERNALRDMAVQEASQKAADTKVDYNNLDYWKDGIFKSVDETVRMAPEQRIAPLMKEYDKMKPGKDKTAFGKKILDIKQGFEAEDALLTKETRKAMYERDKTDYEYSKKAELEKVKAVMKSITDDPKAKIPSLTDLEKIYQQSYGTINWFDPSIKSWIKKNYAPEVYQKYYGTR